MSDAGEGLGFIENVEEEIERRGAWTVSAGEPFQL